MFAILRNKEILFIGSEKQCLELKIILDEYHKYDSYRIEMIEPSEQDYCLRAITTSMQYGD